MTTLDTPRIRSAPLAQHVAVLSQGLAALVHLQLAPSHFDVSVAVAASYLTLALVQLTLAATMLLPRASRVRRGNAGRLWRGGALVTIAAFLVNGLAICVEVLTRSAGPVFGGHDAHPGGSVGLSLLTVVLELISIAALLSLMDTDQRRRAGNALVAAAVAVVALRLGGILG